MDYPFRMYGRLIEIYRFQVEYIEEQPDETGAIQETPASTYCPTEEEAQAVASQRNGTVTPIDHLAYNWMNGIEVADVPDTFAEAIRIYEMGPTAYAQKVAFDASKEADQLRADLDYMMLLGGLT